MLHDWFRIGTFLLIYSSSVSATNTDAIDLKCDFINKKCDWELANQWNWVRTFKAGQQLDGPPIGELDNALAIGLNKFSNSEMRSPTISAMQNETCFQFDYYVKVDKAKNSGLQLIVVKEHTLYSTIWYSGGLNSDQWHKAKVTVPPQSEAFNIKFDAYGQEGFVALQATKFMLQPGRCPSHDCDFESGSCEFTSMPNRLNLKVNIITALSTNLFKADHTSRSPNGHLAYLNFAQRSSEPVGFASPSIPALGVQCFSFWFILSKSKTLTLKLNLLNNTDNSENTIWTNDETHLASEWIRVQKSITFHGSTRLIFRVSSSSAGESLALDDIQFSPFACSPPVSCKFDGDTCNWKNEEVKNNLLWTVGPFERVENLKKLAHNPYQFLGTSRLYTDFTIATGSMQLLSEFVDGAPHGACFKLNYYVLDFAPTTASFVVSQIDINGKQTALWAFSNLADLREWQVERISIASGTVPYRLSLQVNSSVSTTFINVQEIGLQGGSCSGSTTVAVPTTAPAAPPSPIDCNFENGTFCKWAVSGIQGTEFAVAKCRTVLSDPSEAHVLAPSMDHTTSSENGHFAYMINAKNESIWTSLKSTNPFISKTICFSFYYYLNTFGLSRVELTMEQSRVVEGGFVHRSYYKLLFRSYGTNELNWRRAAITIEPNKPYNHFLLEAYISKGILAIDDIRVVLGKCQDSDNTKSCDFEEGSSCLYEPIFIAGSSNQWKIYKGDDMKPKKIADHTTHTVGGHFYGLDLSTLRGNQHQFQVETPKLDAFKCFKFSYYLADVSPNVKLYVGVKSDSADGNLIVKWKVAGSTSGIWFRHQIDISTTGSIIMGIDSNGERTGKVFVDDVLIDKKSCHNVNLCDFEDGTLCNLQAVQQDVSPVKSEYSGVLAHNPIGFHLTTYYLADYVDRTWHVYSPATLHQYIDRDYTLNSAQGKYLLLTASDGKNNRGIVITDRYSLNGNQTLCLSFALFKFGMGNSSGSSIFEVYQGESMEDKFGVKLWAKDSTTIVDRKNNWEVIQIVARPLKPESVDLFFFFVGTIQTKDAYMALDNVQILAQCQHPVNPEPTTTITPGTQSTPKVPKGFFRCDSGRIIADSLTCNWVNDCEQGEDEKYCGSCDWSNHNWCRYRQSSSLEAYYSFRFSDQSKVGPNSGTKGKNFLVVSGDWAADAMLQSPLIQSSYSECTMSFYYHYNESLNNRANAFIKVSLRYPSSDWVMLWHSKFVPMPQNVWNHVSFKLLRVSHPYELWIDAIEYYHKGTQYQALDSVQLSNCAPPKPLPAGEHCSGYTCKNGVCINANALCDFVDDCGDGSDENDKCNSDLMTSFEDGYGRWGDALKKGWTISSSGADVRNNPPFDHTTSYHSGHYLFAKAEYLGRAKTVYAEIDSPPVNIRSSGNSITNCRITFYKFANSANASLLVIKQNQVTMKREVIDELIGVDSQFNRQSYSIGGNFVEYKIILSVALKVSAGMWTNPWLAVDDISFSGCTIAESVPHNVTSPGGVTYTTERPSNCSTVTCIGSDHQQRCLAPTQLCDFVEDCADGIDERDCGNCDFDQGTQCHWENTQTSSTWQLVRKAKESKRPPKVDADNNPLGGYSTVVSTATARSTATIRSPRINGATSQFCKLQFAYACEYGATVEVWRIGAGDASTSRQRLLSDYFYSHDWTTIRIDVGRQAAGFNIEISVSATFSEVHRIAVIDNIKWLECSPDEPPPTTARPIDVPKSINCDFESDLCGWQISGPDGIRSNWLRVLNDSRFEPGIDHSCFLQPRPAHCGTWMTTQAKVDNRKENDYLQTTHFISGRYCLTFYYYFYGFDSLNELGLYLLKDKDSLHSYKRQWFRKRALARDWLQQSVELSTSNDHLVFIAKAFRNTVIGLDDITLAPGSCPTSSVDCPMEDNTCDWTADGWKIDSKEKDHSTQAGHYLVVDKPVGVAATLRKPLATLPYFSNATADLKKAFCLKLYYMMNTRFGLNHDSTSMLQVKVFPQSGTTAELTFNVTIFEAINDDTINNWTPVTIDLVASKDAIVEIDGITHSADTKILLDDVSFSPEVCQVNGNCDFEKDMCGWNNIGNFGSNPSWLPMKPTNAFINGKHLPYDHTTGSAAGRYLILPTQSERYYNSWMRSDLLHRVTSQLCFSLYYFVQGNTSTVTPLQLIYHDLTHPAKDSITFHLNTSTELQWLHFEHEFSHIGRIFQFEFKAQAVDGLLSDLAIDDIHLFNGPCGGAKPTPAPVPTEETVLDDNFELPTDNWQYDAARWKVTSFASQKSAYAPQRDHTLETGDGKYLLFSSPDNAINASSPPDFSLNSAISLPYTHDHCLHFWFYEDGEGAFCFSFAVHNVSASKVVSTFKSNIENRARWSPVNVFIPQGLIKSNAINFTIHYQPTAARLDEFHVLALDDIEIRPGECSQKYDYTYTFTNGYEDLSLEYLRPVQKGIGLLTSGSSHYGAHSPTVDHTSGTSEGVYFLFWSPPGLRNIIFTDTISVMNLPADRGDQFTCVRFAYQKFGTATLKVLAPAVHAYDYSQYSAIWEATNNSKANWSVVEVNSHNDFEQKVVFYLEKQLDKESFVALDDITVLKHKCPPVIDCDFDDHRTCSYSPYNDASTGKLNFGIATAPTQDPKWPGPQYDINGNWGGGYLYLTSYRSPNANQTTAKIISGPRAIMPNKELCLTMFIVLTSKSDELRISLRRYGLSWNDASRDVELRHLHNVTISTWYRWPVEIEETILIGADEIQVIIEGRLGANSSGLIAIDGITFSEGDCQFADGLLCENGNSVSRDKICNFVRDCPSGLDELNCGNANLENGLGGWSNQTRHKQDWLLTTPTRAKLINSDAPQSDADKNSAGHFLMLSTSRSSESASAEMALNTGHPGMYLKDAFRSCVMQFDYFIKGSTRPSIRVQIGEDTANLNTIYLIGDNTDGWHRAYAHIGFRYGSFVVDVLGRMEPGSQGAVALDNIQFTNCSFPPPIGRNASCPVAGQFECRDRNFCVDQDEVCDFVNACGDGSDELNCARFQNRCNFEFSLGTCGLVTDSAQSNVQWTIESGMSSPDSSNLPQIDNTKRSKSGHFLALQPKANTVHLLNWAQFYSPMWKATNGASCRMRFYYFIHGPTATIQGSKIQVYIQYAAKTTQEPNVIFEANLDVKGDLQQRWNIAVAHFSSISPFQFVLRGMLADNSTGLAIDDITYDPNCQPSSTTRVTTTTAQPTSVWPTTSSTLSTRSTTTKPLDNHKPSSSPVGKIILAVTIPILLVIVLALSYYGFRQYQKSKRTGEETVLSMREIQSRYGH